MPMKAALMRSKIVSSSVSAWTKFTLKLGGRLFFRLGIHACLDLRHKRPNGRKCRNSINVFVQIGIGRSSRNKPFGRRVVGGFHPAKHFICCWHDLRIERVLLETLLPSLISSSCNFYP